MWWHWGDCTWWEQVRGGDLGDCTGHHGRTGQWELWQVTVFIQSAKWWHMDLALGEGGADLLST